MTLIHYILIGLGAFAAGAVNALAGGGTLITFPLLTALGIPVVAANVTNTVALCPGYFGATLAQRNDLMEQKPRLWLLLPAGLVGGLAGGLLLLSSGERLFTRLVPYLILLASVLLAIGEPLKKWLSGFAQAKMNYKRNESLVLLPVSLAAVYGGYFGAGLSVIILAALGLFYNDSLTRLNALKQAIAFATNIAAAIVFLFSGQVLWAIAGMMVVCALIGGSVGGKLAGRINPIILRWVVVVIGVIVAVIYFIK
jgi:uncharacterized membrane protein YfcA